MSFTVKVDFSALKKIEAMAKELAPKLLAEVSRQTLYFVSDIQRNQMSGRRGSIYLNIGKKHGGTLRGSWFSETKADATGITTRAFTRVKYAAIHQHGGVIHMPPRQSILSFRAGRGEFVSPSKKAFQRGSGQYQQKVSVGGHDIRIPKRLFIEEEFMRQMPDRYERAVLKVIDDLMKK